MRDPLSNGAFPADTDDVPIWWAAPSTPDSVSSEGVEEVELTAEDIISQVRDISARLSAERLGRRCRPRKDSTGAHDFHVRERPHVTRLRVQPAHGEWSHSGRAVACSDHGGVARLVLHVGRFDRSETGTSCVSQVS